jgi:Translation initiation factor 1 (eIF-1/SUI1) and related proteins
MRNKKSMNPSGLVYSTNPDLNLQQNEEDIVTAPPAEQKLIAGTDKKNRGGKVVTFIKGFSGKTTDLEQLGKSIRTFCGSGGTVKEGEIIIQGDHKEKVVKWLIGNGYILAKKI